MKRSSIVVMAGVLAVLAGGAWWFLSGAPNRAKARAQAYIVGELIDPAGAVFRDVELRGDAICGTVKGSIEPGHVPEFRPFWASIDGTSGQVEPSNDFRGLSASSRALRQMNLDTFRMLHRMHCAP